MTLPDTLSVLDLEDLMTALGRPTDRTNIARALRQTPVEGVAAPARRGRPWRVPAAALPGAVAAVPRRRDARAAAAARREPGPPRSYELPAARLLLAREDLAPLVPRALRRQVRAERRAALAAAAERARRRQAEAERERRREERARAAAEQRYTDAALMQIYFFCRLAVRSARFGREPARPGEKPYWDTPEYESFLSEWSDPVPPAGGPPGWLPPPGAVAAMRERSDPWIDGRTKAMPDGSDLVPDIDLTKPWPWRAESGDA